MSFKTKDHHDCEECSPLKEQKTEIQTTSNPNLAMSCCFDVQDATSPEDKLLNGLRHGTLDLDKIKNLIEVQLANPIKARDIPKNTILHHAARLSVEIINYLVQFDIDINTKNAQGHTPLMIATELPQIIALIKAGANPHARVGHMERILQSMLSIDKAPLCSNIFSTCIMSELTL